MVPADLSTRLFICFCYLRSYFLCDFLPLFIPVAFFSVHIRLFLSRAPSLCVVSPPFCPFPPPPHPLLFSSFSSLGLSYSDTIPYFHPDTLFRSDLVVVVGLITLHPVSPPESNPFPFPFFLVSSRSISFRSFRPVPSDSIPFRFVEFRSAWLRSV